MFNNHWEPFAKGAGLDGCKIFSLAGIARRLDDGLVRFDRYFTTGNVHMAAMRKLPVVLLCRRRRACAVGQIRSTDFAVPHPPRGALRDRHECWARDAMDAVGAHETKRAGRGRRNRVVLVPRRWDQALGLISPQATAAKKPGTPRRARISRNTIAQGRPDCLR
jgi:hypothetical protein